MKFLFEMFMLSEAMVDPEHILKTVRQSVPSPSRVTPQFILGKLSSPKLPPENDPDYESVQATIQTLARLGLLQRVGGGWQKTPVGSRASQLMRNYAAQNTDRGVNYDKSSDLATALRAGGGNAAGQAKHYIRSEVGEAYQRYLQKLDDSTKKLLVDVLPTLSYEDISLIKQAYELKKQKKSYMGGLLDKHPESVDKLVAIGLLSSDGSINGSKISEFFGSLSKISAAALKQANPGIYEKVMRLTANTQLKVNSIVAKLHPDSPTASNVGKRVYNLLKSANFNMKNIENVDVPQELKHPLSVLKKVFNAETSFDMIDMIDKEFNSYQNFKSLDRISQKTKARTTGTKQLFNV